MNDRAKLCAWWADRQGLLTRDPLATPREVFARFGWSRSIAGCNPYLTAFSRAGLTRAQVDRSVSELEISELPAARSCTYVLPRDDYAVGLKMGEALSGTSELKLALKFGSSEEELDRLAKSVLRALEGGPNDPAGMRDQLGDLVRYFGEEGKKRGLANSLPIALARLQSKGKIVRRPVSGRLDEQRYNYILWRENPPDTASLTREQALTEAAKRFFTWIGPASLTQFANFAAISGKAAKAATDGLGLKPIGDLLILSEDVDRFESFQVPTEPSYRLVNCLDSLLLLQDGLDKLFSEESRRAFAPFQGSPDDRLKELNYNAILDRGSIIGLWEFDAEAGRIVYALFKPMDDELREEILRTERFVREQLGDARTFSLDSVKSRKPKIERLRAHTS